MKAVADKIKGRAPLRVLVYDSGSSGVFTCSGRKTLKACSSSARAAKTSSET